MDQTNPIPEMNTPDWPLNFTNYPRRGTYNRLRRQPGSTNSPSVKLNQHPKWMGFAQLLSEEILSRYPDLRQPFLALLDRADLL
jgi:hypothetical protein